MAAAGLVPDEDVADAGVDECVIGREVGAAGKSEDDVHALRLQTCHQRIDRSHRNDSEGEPPTWARRYILGGIAVVVVLVAVWTIG